MSRSDNPSYSNRRTICRYPHQTTDGSHFHAPSQGDHGLVNCRMTADGGECSNLCKITSMMTDCPPAVPDMHPSAMISSFNLYTTIGTSLGPKLNHINNMTMSDNHRILWWDVKLWRGLLTHPLHDG